MITSKISSKVTFAILYSCISFFVVKLKEFSDVFCWFISIFQRCWELTSCLIGLRRSDFQKTFLDLIPIVSSRKWKSWKCKANKNFVEKFTKSNNNRVLHLFFLIFNLLVGGKSWELEKKFPFLDCTTFLSSHSPSIYINLNN